MTERNEEALPENSVEDSAPSSPKEQESDADEVTTTVELLREASSSDELPGPLRLTAAVLLALTRNATGTTVFRSFSLLVGAIVFLLVTTVSLTIILLWAVKEYQLVDPYLSTEFRIERIQDDALDESADARKALDDCPSTDSAGNLVYAVTRKVGENEEVIGHIPSCGGRDGDFKLNRDDPDEVARAIVENDRAIEEIAEAVSHEDRKYVVDETVERLSGDPRLMDSAVYRVLRTERSRKEIGEYVASNLSEDRVATHLNYRAIAGQLDPRGVARSVDFSDVESELDYGELAHAIDYKKVASKFDSHVLADSLSESVEDSLAQKVSYERVAKKLNAEDLAKYVSRKNVAKHIQASEIARQVSTETIARELDSADIASGIDADKLATELEPVVRERLSEKLSVRAIVRDEIERAVDDLNQESGTESGSGTKLADKEGK